MALRQAARPTLILLATIWVASTSVAWCQPTHLGTRRPPVPTIAVVKSPTRPLPPRAEPLAPSRPEPRTDLELQSSQPTPPKDVAAPSATSTAQPPPASVGQAANPESKAATAEPTTTDTPASPPDTPKPSGGPAAEGGAEEPQPPGRPEAPARGQPPPRILTGTERPPDNEPPAPLGASDVEVTANAVSAEGDVVRAEGHVLIEMPNYRMHSDAAVLDFGRDQANLQGNVMLETPEQVVTGDSLQIDLKTGDWTFSATPPERVRSTIRPTQFIIAAKEPLYISGYKITALARKKVEGPEGAETIPTPRRIIVDHARLTSCNLEHPHWHLEGDSEKALVVKPGRVAVIDRPSLYILGHKIFTYPGKIPIPLRERRYSAALVPEVGYNEVEGYYAHFQHPYITGARSDGIIRLHLSTRRYVGLGVAHAFDNGQNRGLIDFFVEPKPGSYSLNLRHMLRWKQTFTSNFSSSVQHESGYFSQSATSLSHNLRLSYRDRDLSTKVSFRDTRYLGTFSSTRFDSNIQVRQRIRKLFEYNLEANYRLFNRTNFPAADQELETSLTFQGGTKWFDWRTSATQRFDVDRGDYPNDNYRVLNVVPEVSLRSNLRRLHVPLPRNVLTKYMLNLPIQLTLGRYREEPGTLLLYRVRWDLPLPGYTKRLGDWGRFSTTSSFVQVWYNRHASQHTWRNITSFTADLPDKWSTQFTHYWQQPQGFAALRTDVMEDANRMQLAFARRGDHTRLNFSTGYDIKRNRYYDIQATGQLRPSLHSRLAAQTGYSIERSEMRPLVVRYDYSDYPNLRLGASTRYDFDRGRLSTVSLDADWLISRQWAVDSRLAYDPSRNTFDDAQFRVTRDLHCWVSQLVWVPRQQEVRFNLSLKAFPQLNNIFGIGRGRRVSAIPGVYF